MVSSLRVDGADVSHYQGSLDLQKAAKAGLQFLYHKATEGTAFRDPEFKARREDARTAGLPFGGYHFARFTSVADAVKEAKFFLKVLDPQPGDLVPVLDFETAVPHGVSARDCCDAFMAEIVRELGARGLTGTPMHYGPDDFGPSYRFPRWVPRYSNSNMHPKVRWDIWQFSNGTFGVPKQFAGLGRCDLNTFRAGFGLKNILLTKKKATAVRPAQQVKIMHCSGRFNDTDAEHAADALAIFERAKKQNVGWITGTEGGPGSGNWIPQLEKQAKAHGFRFFSDPSTDAWIAVNEDLIDEGFKSFVGPIVVRGKAHSHTAKKIVSVQFYNYKLGRINIIAGHYLTKGRPDPKSPEYSQFLAENKAFAKAIGEYAVKVGAGADLVFYGGDQNIPDNKDDTFLGLAPMTTAWDELKHYENTGHGNIDVIASYNADSRVKAVSIHAYDDKKFFYNGDHYMVEAVYAIQLLKK